MNISRSNTENNNNLIESHFKLKCEMITSWVYDSLEKYKKLNDGNLWSTIVDITTIFKITYVDARLNLWSKVEFFIKLDDKYTLKVNSEILENIVKCIKL